ncbi:MAG: 6-bladed beta-propeller [Candidatus Aminicenantes bacterium]|nr:6-bladed beta-propeller [Candidatus Aminicenantes bacterium]
MKKILSVSFLICLLNSYSSSIWLQQYSGSKQESEEEKKFAKIYKKWRKEYPLPKNATELELKSSFPSEDLIEEDIYLWGAHFIANDSFGNIYVSNRKAHFILKFDPSGHFLQKIGRKGQGPGELMEPGRIMTGKDFLAVYDRMNRRIQFFDQKGNYVKSIKLYKTFRDMTINEEGLIFATPILMTSQMPLIDVLSQDGKLLYSFGKPKSFKRNWRQLNAVVLDLNKKGELLMAFRHFPVVRKYSVKGELLAEYQIDHFKWKEYGKENRKGVSKQGGYFNTIDRIKGSDEGFYLLNVVPRIEILEFDKNGKLIMDYWHLCFSYLSATDDFIVQKRHNENIYYILQERSEGMKVCIYGQKLKHK